MIKTLVRIGRTLRAVAEAAVFGLARILVTSAQGDLESGDRRLHDADLFGEYNYRTGRLDAGTDPYGWYDDG